MERSRQGCAEVRALSAPALTIRGLSGRIISADQRHARFRNIRAHRDTTGEITGEPSGIFPSPIFFQVPFRYSREEHPRPPARVRGAFNLHATDVINKLTC